MELEYSKPMAKKEVDSFFNELKSQRLAEYKKSQAVLERYKSDLLNEYHISDDMFNKRCKETKNQRAEALTHKINKTCICGAKIKFISDPYNFWGCTSYHNRDIEHRNYEDREIERYFPWPVPNHWISDIRTKIGLPKTLRTGHIYQFYLDNGLDDLLLKYTGNSSESVVYKLCDTRDKAGAFEKQQFEILSTILTKCQYQFGVRYKYQGSKEKIAFIDILGSDEQNVFIYECKSSPKDVNICQRDLYIEIVSRILTDLSIAKELKFVYLFEREDSND